MRADLAFAKCATEVNDISDLFSELALSIKLGFC